MKKSFSIIFATVGVAWFLDLFTINPSVSCVSKKDEMEEVKKKLLNKYELLFIPKGLWLFNKHLLI